jgi:hypothetical protein
MADNLDAPRCRTPTSSKNGRSKRFGKGPSALSKHRTGMLCGSPQTSLHNTCGLRPEREAREARIGDKVDPSGL